jgi:hypothetical protein
VVLISTAASLMMVDWSLIGAKTWTLLGVFMAPTLGRLAATRRG